VEQEFQPSALSGEVYPSLTVMKGKNVAQRFPVVTDRVVIGRRRGDLVLPDPEVSGTHAEVLRTVAGYLIRDLGSTNGTFVNDRQVREEPLHTGDRIRVGRSELLWADGASARLEPSLEPHADGLPGAELSTPRSSRPPISVGLYDTMADLAGLSALVEDTLVGFRDDDGTQLMDLQSAGVELKLPTHSVVQLEVIGGPEKGRVITLPSGNVVMGRYGTDIVLKDHDVSRRHMTLEVYGRDQIFLRDLGSTNGCYVNSVKTGFCKLQSGDTIVVGRSVMQLMVKDPG